MSDAASADPAPMGDTASEPRYPKDLYLDILMDFVLGSNNDSEDGSFGITLSLQGQAISGLAISHDAWTRHFVDQLREASSGLGDAMSTLFDNFNARNREVAARAESSEQLRPSRRFIHLRDATVFTGTTRLNVGLTRVALDDVSGWSLGSLTA